MLGLNWRGGSSSALSIVVITKDTKHVVLPLPLGYDISGIPQTAKMRFLTPTSQGLKKGKWAINRALYW